MCHHLFPHVKCRHTFSPLYFTMTLKACDKTPKRLLAFVESDFEKTKKTKKKKASSKATRWCARCALLSSGGDFGGARHTAAQWYRSKTFVRSTGDFDDFDDDEWLCKKCYRKEMLRRATASDRACVECDSKETTGGSWLRSKRHPGKYLCFNCYSRELSNVSNKRCASCRAEKTGQKWYKSKGRDETIGDSGAKYLCRRCYEKERLALMKGTKSCSTCSTRTTAGRWCKSKTAAGADLCRKCYRKELKDAATKERIQRVDDELEKIRLAISG